jgi:hypothetical protein
MKGIYTRAFVILLLVCIIPNTALAWSITDVFKAFDRLYVFVPLNFAFKGAQYALAALEKLPISQGTTTLPTLIAEYDVKKKSYTVSYNVEIQNYDHVLSYVDAYDRHMLRARALDRWRFVGDLSHANSNHMMYVVDHFANVLHHGTTTQDGAVTKYYIPLQAFLDVDTAASSSRFWSRKDWSDLADDWRQPHSYLRAHDTDTRSLSEAERNSLITTLSIVANAENDLAVLDTLKHNGDAATTSRITLHSRRLLTETHSPASSGKRDDSRIATSSAKNDMTATSSSVRLPDAISPISTSSATSTP